MARGKSKMKNGTYGYVIYNFIRARLSTLMTQRKYFFESP